MTNMHERAIITAVRDVPVPLGVMGSKFKGFTTGLPSREHLCALAAGAETFKGSKPIALPWGMAK
ncbi:hypothetical protein AUC68_07050 [Methyloceanibacter methanicus]|uniref:Uncharacterized protein n=1 Tax=Methyloceanibacter methanicus TaxID=1774968 RepID=A0A1E3W085_9HYPH|nr:hypothetical protein [Methyloceanibacter methanicus]ODR98921.1 hypothetical protein AUC68_07050 [Methyloceanibacter methanicus]